MSTFQSIEEKLSQLVPASISEDGLEAMDDAIDQRARANDGQHDVADIDSVVIDDGNHSSWYHKKHWKAAAAVALLIVPAVMFSMKSPVAEPSVASNHALSGPGEKTEMLVLNRTNRIDSSEDDGLIIPEDGSAPHYRYRYHVTDEERVRDAKTGTVVIVRQPRQEVVAIPVTQF